MTRIFLHVLILGHVTTLCSDAQNTKAKVDYYVFCRATVEEKNI